MQRAISLAMCATTSLFAIACSGDSAAPTGLAVETGALSAEVDFRRASEDVARGIALAMGDAGVRAAVRDAMRESLVTEHKLLLQDFVKPHAAACW